MSFHMMKQCCVLAAVFIMSWCCGNNVAFAVQSCADSDSPVKCSEFKPRYYVTGESRFSFPLAELSAKTARDSYSNSNYDDALKNAGFKDITLLRLPQIELNAFEITTATLFSLKDSNLLPYTMRELARNSLQAVVGHQTAYIDGIKRRIIAIAFRGTQFDTPPDKYYDLAIDAAAGQIRYAVDDANTHVHEGFMTCEKVMEEELELSYEIDGIPLSSIINQASTSNDIFWVTGHSLGGGIATLYAARLIDRGVKRDNLISYTFGAPSVGNSYFRDVFFNESQLITPQQLAKKINLHRVRDKYDLIPYSAYTAWLAEDASAFKMVTDFGKWTFLHIGYPMVYAYGKDVTSEFQEGTTSMLDLVGLNIESHDMKHYIGNTQSIGAITPRADISIPTVSASPSSQITYNDNIAVTLSMNENGKIFYTTDGSIPDAALSNTHLYIAPINIDQTTTINVIATDNWGNTSKPQKFTYSIREDPASNAYLEIQVPTTVRALSLGDLLRLTPADKVRLYPRNDPSWPDFKELTGSITVWLLHKNGEMYSASGTLLADGGVEFSTTANMPADSYFTVYLVSSNDNGVKISAPIYQTTQLVEIGISNSTGTTPPSTTGSITLPRTGQYLCYDSAGATTPCAGTVQDGEIQAGETWTVPRFEDNGNQTITDKLTGLIWSKNANPAGMAKTWQQALSYVITLNNQNYLNHSDWRLPNRIELESLLNLGLPNPGTRLIGFGFYNVEDNAPEYWSSSTYSGNPGSAWIVRVGGDAGNTGKAASFGVWPVRSEASGSVLLPKTNQTTCYDENGATIGCAGTGQDGDLQKGVEWPNSRFTANTDQTMTDNLTGLIWSKNGNLAAANWQNALDYINTLNNQSYLGYNDWRLPNSNELASLGNNLGQPIIGNWLNEQGFSVQRGNYYWSSSSWTVYSGMSHHAMEMYMYTGAVYAGDKTYINSVLPVRGGKVDPATRIFPPQVTFTSENLPDGSYQVGDATKAWRFKSGSSAITGLKAVRVSMDNGLGITQTEIAIGDVAANTEFLVYLPINPVHDSISTKSSFWKLVDGNGVPVTITNSKTGQFWVKVITNRPPVFNQLQLDSVAGQVNAQVQLPILASDPDGDSLTYSVTSGGGSIVDGTWMGKSAKLYQHTFSSAGFFPITIQVNDGHGDVAQYTIQAVIAPNGTIANFYQDVPFPAGGDPAQWCDNSVPPVFTPNRAQYLAINYLTLNGITIGRPVKNDPTKRVFEGCNFAKQAEALAMIMKTAATRGFIELDAEMRYLPNLVKIDTANGVYDNFSWAAPYVLKAESLGLIDSADTFDPSMLATRGWMARMITRMMRLNPPMDIIDPSTFVFADSASFSTTDDYDNARSAAYFGYMGTLGASSSFNPSEPMIRADLAMVTARILRTPTVTGISTSGLTDQALYGRTMPALVHGLSFNVTDVTGLVAHRMTVDTPGNVGEEIANPATYTTATVIRPGVGSAAGKLIYSLAQTPVSVPTNPPDISVSETRSLVVMLDAPDNDGNNPVRSIYRMEYGVIFPDQDGDGVRDTLDLWPDNPLYAVDTNGNGIPDNADSLWGLTNRNGSEQIKISGQVMTLQNAVLSGQYAQMMNDASPPTVVSASPATGSQELPLTQAITVTFSRELDISTVTSATVMLSNTTTSATVVGTISYSMGVLTFTPSSALSYANDYQFRITTGIKDLAGHPLAADYLLTFRTEPQNFPPTGTISINNGALYTNTPAVTLAITAADPDGVPWMCISETGSCPDWIPFSTTSTYTITGSAGAKTLSIWFSDGKNLANSTPAATASITYDNTAPTLTLSTLADGAVTRENQVNVTGVARDNVGGSGIASVTVNGKSVEFNSVNGIFSYPLPLMSASTSITVVTTDLAGNSATVTQTVNRDQAAPLLTIETPTDYSASSTALLTVSGTVESGATVSVSLNGAAPVAASVTGTTYTAQVTLVSTTTLNTIQVTAAGLSGKNSSVKRSVRYNSGRWNMDVTDPPQDTLTSSGTYLLKGRVSNVVNAPLTITITRGADTYTPTVTDGAFEQLVTLPSDGLHVFSVLGTDSLGNKLSVTRVFNKGDFEPPVISQFSMPSASSSFTVPLTFTASDNVGVTGWCQVYGTATVANSCVWSSTPITSRTFNNQGLKTITGFVKDAAGNISAPAIATTTITVADQPMTVTLAGTGNGTVTSNPAGISCISGSTSGCSASFTAGPAVSLLQTPQSDSTFGGWGGDCSGNGACSNTMTTAKSVTATFNLIPRAMIGSTGYASLGLAYSSVAPGDTATIMVLGIDLGPEILTVDSNRKISLTGGYTSSYDKGATPTSLKGPLTISTDSLTVEGVAVK